MVLLHWAVVIGNFCAFFILAFQGFTPYGLPWYVCLPLCSFIALISFSRVLDCPMTRYENKMRVKLGKPTIKGFIGHYFLKPYVTQKSAKSKRNETHAKDKVNIKFKEAFDFTKWVFEKNKVPSKYSNICADVLLSADELGFTTHGLSRLGYYIKRIKDGVIDVKATPEIIRDNKSCVTIDGHNALGQIVGKFAMNQAVEKTQKHGISCVAVKNSSHYGIASYYSRYATKQNLVGMSFTNARPAVAPYGGCEPKMGTNPYAIAFPSDMKYPFSIDCATSAYQRGDLEVKARATPDNYVPSCAIVSENQNLTFERSLGWLKKGMLL